MFIHTNEYLRTRREQNQLFEDLVEVTRILDLEPGFLVLLSLAYRMTIKNIINVIYSYCSSCLILCRLVCQILDNTSCYPKSEATARTPGRLLHIVTYIRNLQNYVRIFIITYSIFFLLFRISRNWASLIFAVIR